MTRIDWSKAPEGYDVHINFDGREAFYRDDGPRYVRPNEHYVFKTDAERMDGIITLRPDQWNGEGLPPVGIDAEVLFDSNPLKYVGCKILAHDEGRAVYRFTSGLRKGEYSSDLCRFTRGNPIPMFRPVRTPEQIAADKRLHEIRNALTTIKAGQQPFPNDLVRGNITLSVVEAMIDAGYRKEVKS